jgi:hypothetical protein
MDHGYIDDANITYIYCFNGMDNQAIVDELRQSRSAHNVSFFIRENIGLDFGAWSQILLQDNMYRNYDNYILLNNTVKGPFLPLYVKQRWTDIFISMLDHKVKLVGSTINYYAGKPHVQSYFLCFDRVAMDIGIETNIFTTEINNIYKDQDLRQYGPKDRFVEDYEVGFSREIIKKGYNIACMMKGMENIDYQETKTNNLAFDYGSGNGDMTYDGSYFGISIHPYEVIFIKANRGISPHVINQYSNFHNRTLGNKN